MLTPSRNSPPSLLNLRFRSVGSFLVAYASRLSKGEFFIETASPWPLGARTDLHLQVPGVAAIALSGAVTWTRPAAVGPGEPPGMSLSLSSPIESHGPTIDILASMYMGTRVLLAATDPTSRAVLSRYLRSILSCDIVEADLFGGNRHEGIDLAVVDFDATREAGQALVRFLKEDPRTAEIPIIVLAQSETDRARGAELGADEVLPNPPSFADVHNAVVHLLSRALLSLAG
jgi:CheY-like chemotaxis protein/Tfp pilus assembly protein PilZ